MDVVAQIDAEIARLEQAKALLTVETGGKAVRKTAKPKKKRNLTPEGRARIAAAVKKRWAKQKAMKKSAS